MWLYILCGLTKFFFSLLWCSHIGNHMQDLAKFGYMKKNYFCNPTIVWWLTRTSALSMAKPLQKTFLFGNFFQFFYKNKAFISSKNKLHFDKKFHQKKRMVPTSWLTDSIIILFSHLPIWNLQQIRWCCLRIPPLSTFYPWNFSKISTPQLLIKLCQICP